MKTLPSLLLALACGLPSSVARAESAEVPKILVFDFVAEGFTDGEVRVIEERVAKGLTPMGDVMASKDIKRLLELEGQRQALDCDSNSDSCLAEIAGAMGARYVVNGTLARMGGLLVCNLTLFDAQASRSVMRESAEATSPEELLRRVDEAVLRLAAPIGGGKAKEQARAPTSSGPSALSITGGVIAGLGVAAGLLGAGGALIYNGIASDPDQPADKRFEAKPVGLGMLGVAAVGTAAVVLGSALLVVGLAE